MSPPSRFSKFPRAFLLAAGLASGTATGCVMGGALGARMSGGLMGLATCALAFSAARQRRLASEKIRQDLLLVQKDIQLHTLVGEMKDGTQAMQRQRAKMEEQDALIVSLQEHCETLAAASGDPAVSVLPPKKTQTFH